MLSIKSMLTGLVIALIGFNFVSPERFYLDFFFATSFLAACLGGGLLSGIAANLLGEKGLTLKEALFSIGGVFGIVAIGKFFLLWYLNYREFFVTSYDMAPWWFTGSVIIGIFVVAAVISGFFAFLSSVLLRSKVQ